VSGGLRHFERSRRLKLDALVCLLDTHGQGDMVFGTVVKEKHAANKYIRPKKDELGYSLEFDHADRIRVRLAVTNPNEYAIKFLLKTFPCKSQGLTLIEFLGILLLGFEPILKALQAMKKSGDVPFVELMPHPLLRLQY
jgi:hypothetical protein